MKKCPQCGAENLDDAQWCCHCGADCVQSPPATQAPPAWQRVAVLENEVEAERLGVELEAQGIPHVMISYSDTAYDGLFQLSRGWGHLEAAPEHKEAILAILQDIRQTKSAPEPGPAPTNGPAPKPDEGPESAC